MTVQRCKSAYGRCKGGKVRGEGSGTRTKGWGVALPRLQRVGSGLRTDLGGYGEAPVRTGSGTIALTR